MSPGRVAAEPSGHYLRAVLDTPFTDEQLQIVTHPLTPQLVVAGAGSGKTTVMAARVVHVVAWHRVPPGAVLGLTFTNKAASELAARVRGALARVDLAALCADGGEDAVVAEEPTVSTYHAYAARLFADHALRIGREPAAGLLTEAGAWQLAVRVVRTASGPFRALDWRPATLARYLLDLDAEMAEHLAPPEAVRACDERLRAAVEGVPTPVAVVSRVAAMASARDELVGLVEDYRACKRRLDLVDFGDQIALAAQIAGSCPDVGRAEREQFRVVLLDEYQDTGVAQRSMLTALFGGGHPVTAVGDPCQSIYGWRGASVGNLLRFGEHFHGAHPRGAHPRGAHHEGCRPQYLMTNFRSGGRILQLANEVSRALRQPRAESRRPPLDVPVLVPTAGKAESGEVRCALHHTVADEAEWVADEVVRVLADGLTPSAVAILCRRRADFPLLHRNLVARGVPVEVVGLGGLLAMPEVADVVATLEVVADPTANAALLRLLTGPRWRIGPRDLVALGRRAAQLLRGDGPARGADLDADTEARRALAAAAEGVDPCDVVALADALDDLGPPADYSPEAYARMSLLAAELAGLRPLLSAPVVEVVTEVIRRAGLDVEILAAGDGAAAARSANLSAFLAHASGFVAIDGDPDLVAFLAFLAAARDAEDGLDVGGVSAADTVKLMTVHKAKGLEWEVVVVPGVTGEVFPSAQPRARWTSAAKVLPYELRGDAADLPDLPELSTAGLGAFSEACKAEELEEERRLAYVACTRSKRQLLVSGYVWGATQQKPKPPSTFLLEVRAACNDGIGHVVTWCDEPAADNPLRAAGAEDVEWPPAYDRAALQRRLAGAELVRRAIAAPADSAALLGRLSPAERRVAERWMADSDLLLAELAEQRATVREVPLPRALTTSQVVRLAQDPDALAADLARPMPRRPSRAAGRGTRFHAWVEQLFAARPLLAPDDLPGAADAAVPADEELRALQEAFARSAYAGVRPHAVEAPFEVTVGGWLLRGRIDAVYRTDGGYDIVDYKTGLRPADAAARTVQLAVYRLAWAGIAGVPLERVGAAFLYVRTGALVRPAGLPDADGLARLLAAGTGVADAGYASVTSSARWSETGTGSEATARTGGNEP